MGPVLQQTYRMHLLVLARHQSKGRATMLPDMAGRKHNFNVFRTLITCNVIKLSESSLRLMVLTGFDGPTWSEIATPTVGKPPVFALIQGRYQNFARF